MRLPSVLAAVALAFTALAQAQAPIHVPPPIIVPPDPPRPPVTLPAAPQITIEPRPPVLTQCDPAGCWDSSGRRLNRAGPVLIGPNGACAQSGAAVQCP